ncbi:MAG: phospholipase D family protein, partial [Gammaproteobacteria bacterium]|nr:phospholipase D family protein [Gammaproteobacteria bacterium]
LWSLDISGALVLDRLVDAADRGVQVKMLVDDTFLLGEDAILLELAHHPNIEYRVYNPYRRRADGFTTRQALNLAEFHRLDHRMHNKSMVVDNRIAIVGGRNIADEYFGLHDEANFRDLEVIVGGPIVLEVSSSFDEYWNDRWSFPIGMLSHIETTPADLEAARHTRQQSRFVYEEETAADRQQSWNDLVATAFDGKAVLFADEPPAENPDADADAPIQVANALTNLFDDAREEIIIVSAYLIPTPELEGAVRRAIERGVRIRMLTNSIRSNNHLAAHSAYRNHIETLLESGAELHEVRIDAHDRHVYMLSPVSEKNLALHAKALIIDSDKVFIGSANLDPRSLRINTEMGFLMESPALNAALRADVAPDFELTNAWALQFDENGNVLWVSNEVTLTSQPAMSTLQRIEDWFFAHLPLEDEM